MYWILIAIGGFALGMYSGRNALQGNLADALAINGPAKQAAFGSSTLNRGQVVQRLKDADLTSLRSMLLRVKQADVGIRVIDLFESYVATRSKEGR